MRCKMNKFTVLDRRQKSISAQKKVRKELHKTPIPQILRNKFSAPDEKPPSPKPFAQGYLFDITSSTYRDVV